MGERKEGLAAALERTGAGDPPIEPAEQGELLPLASDPDPVKTPDRPAAPRGPGRPKGSTNKRTEEWTRYLLSQYRSPLEALFATFNKRTVDLAKDLGIQNPGSKQLVELFKAQIAAAVQAAPYVHAKQPTAIDLGGEAGVSLVFNLPAGFRPGEEGAESGGLIDVTPADIRAMTEDEENQEDSET